ncbi:MAG: tonB-system energizer ExbB, partial [Pseudorhodoplanes sp.]
MTITKTALAAAILAVMAVSAQAQQSPTRQIQVLPAPTQLAKAPAIAADPAAAKVEGEAPAADAPAADAAPAPEATPDAGP